MDVLPAELLTEILFLLCRTDPVSFWRCRRVSKTWNSMICSLSLKYDVLCSGLVTSIAPGNFVSCVRQILTHEQTDKDRWKAFRIANQLNKSRTKPSITLSSPDDSVISCLSVNGDSIFVGLEGGKIAMLENSSEIPTVLKIDGIANTVTKIVWIKTRQIKHEAESWKFQPDWPEISICYDVLMAVTAKKKLKCFHFVRKSFLKRHQISSEPAESDLCVIVRKVTVPSISFLASSKCHRGVDINTFRNFVLVSFAEQACLLKIKEVDPGKIGFVVVDCFSYCTMCWLWCSSQERLITVRAISNEGVLTTKYTSEEILSDLPKLKDHQAISSSTHKDVITFADLIRRQVVIKIWTFDCDVFAAVTLEKNLVIGQGQFCRLYEMCMSPSAVHYYLGNLFIGTQNGHLYAFTGNLLHIDLQRPAFTYFNSDSVREIVSLDVSFCQGRMCIAIGKSRAVEVIYWTLNQEEEL